jgi:hypothetical protein
VSPRACEHGDREARREILHDVSHCRAVATNAGAAHTFEAGQDTTRCDRENVYDRGHHVISTPSDVEQRPREDSNAISHAAAQHNICWADGDHDLSESMLACLCVVGSQTRHTHHVRQYDVVAPCSRWGYIDRHCDGHRLVHTAALW